LAFQVTADVPFRASVEVDGELQPNLSGVTLASQLLSAEQRLLQIEGSIRLQSLSEATLRVSALPQEQLHDDPQVTLRVVDDRASFVGQISNAFRDAFAPLQHLARDNGALVAVSASSFGAVGQAVLNDIGPPNGTHYQILYTERISRGTPACGFSDTAAPNWGNFRIEAREYTTYVDGKAVARWQEKVEIFESCWVP
jgi:hypothetical protein